MRFRFVLESSFKQLIRNIKSTVVIILSLTVCVSAVFFMAEALLYSTNFLKNIAVNKRTYNLHLSAGGENPGKRYDFYEAVMHDENFPEIEFVSNIFLNPVKQDNMEVYIAPNVYLHNHPYYTPSLNLLEGRPFTEEELRNGSNVIIIADNINDWHDGDPLQVGDTVIMNDKTYEIIGIDRQNSYITESNLLASQDFIICIDQIRFASLLSPNEEQLLTDLCAELRTRPKTVYSEQASGFAMHVITYIGLIALVLYCAFSIISQLFDYMVKSRLYEYNIYKVLGISNKLLLALFYTPILLISALSFALGLVIYHCSDALQYYIGMEDVLPTSASLVCCVLVVSVLIVTTFPQYNRLKRASAVETR